MRGASALAAARSHASHTASLAPRSASCADTAAPTAAYTLCACRAPSSRARSSAAAPRVYASHGASAEASAAHAKAASAATAPVAVRVTVDPAAAACSARALCRPPHRASSAHMRGSSSGSIGAAVLVSCSGSTSSSIASACATCTSAASAASKTFISAMNSCCVAAAIAACASSSCGPSARSARRRCSSGSPSEARMSSTRAMALSSSPCWTERRTRSRRSARRCTRVSSVCCASRRWRLA